MCRQVMSIALLRNGIRQRSLLPQTDTLAITCRNRAPEKEEPLLTTGANLRNLAGKNDVSNQFYSSKWLIRVGVLKSRPDTSPFVWQIAQRLKLQPHRPVSARLGALECDAVSCQPVWGLAVPCVSKRLLPFGTRGNHPKRVPRLSTSTQLTSPTCC